MLDFNDNDEEDMFPLTANLGTSCVDPSKLVSYMYQDDSNIGMKNFKSRRNQQQATATPAKQPQSQSCPTGGVSMARLRWRMAAQKARSLGDPWSDFKLNSCPQETCIRHRYNAIKKIWTKDECTVKIEPKKFEEGAMRACFRMKKLSNMLHTQSWSHASNYVAKCYKDESIPRQRYFDDVKLQMDAKLWAEIYNRHNPPKKIDMFQLSVLEFVNRPGSPLFHLEHYIEGKYIKYNSNSGFVDDAEHMRSTPQAFSHFTYECSNHQMMVVDIQGVGDLYTDPQIHSASGHDYGDGNLGIKGFALFFATHICNDVCRSLGLSQFDLAPSELQKHAKMVSYSVHKRGTQSRGHEEFVIGSPSNFGEYFRHRVRYRSENSCTSDDNNSIVDLPEIDESEGYESSSSPSPHRHHHMSTAQSVFSPNSPVPPSPNVYNGSHPLSIPSRNDTPSVPIQMPMAAAAAPHNQAHHNSNMNNNHNHHMPSHVVPSLSRQHSTSSSNGGGGGGRVRTESSCLDSAFSVDEAANYFRHIEARKMFHPRPSCVFAERDAIRDPNVAGMYRRRGFSFRGSSTDEDDEDGLSSGIGHMSTSGVFSALDEEESILGKVHLELCKYYEVGRFSEPECEEFDEEAAFFHLQQAAQLGVKDALTNIAKIYLQLPRDILPNYKVEDNEKNQSIGFDYMLQNAELKDKNSLFYCARAYDSGVGLSKDRVANWSIAVDFYRRVLDMCDEEASSEDSGYSGDISNECEPSYVMLARLGEMYMQGGVNLERDLTQACKYYSQAAEKATLFGKGRLANKYYMLAEQASSAMDE